MKMDVGGIIASKPLYKDGRIYFGSFDRKFRCISEDGKLEWEFEGDNWFWCDPVYFDGGIVVGCLDHKLYFISQDGELRWEFKTGGPIRSSPLILDGRIIIASGDGRVYSLSRDGEILWKSVDLGSPIYSGIGTDGERLFVMTQKGFLYCLRADNGIQVWSIPLK